MKHKHALIALVLVTAASCGVVGAVHAATSSITCPATVSDSGGVYKVTTTCTFPKPAAVTSTVTQTATATVTATVTASPTAVPTTASPTPTPTPTPSSDPTQPPSGDWPGAGNTGVPAGTVLSAYTGSCTITAAGTVIDAKTLNCPALVVQAANVTIRNSKVNGRILVDTDTNRSWSLTLTDTEVNADGIGGVPAITNGNVIGIRLNIHGGHNGLQCEEHSAHCALRDSWIHGQTLVGGDHLGGVADFGHVVPCDGVDVGGVRACVEMTHNVIACDSAPNSQGGGCTGGLNMLTQWGPLHGALVEGNLFVANVGASYCTYGGYSGGQVSDHIVYRSNVFQRGTNGQCGAYGPVTNFDVKGAGNVWSGNVWDDGGTVQPAN